MSISKNHPEVLKWIENNPTKRYSDFKKEHPRSTIIPKYFYNTKYAWLVSMKSAQLKVIESQVARDTQSQITKDINGGEKFSDMAALPPYTFFHIPDYQNNFLNDNLVNIASNVVIALKVNPDIGVALDLSTQTLELAVSTVSGKAIIIKSIVRMINNSHLMTKDMIIENLCELVGVKRKKTIVNTSRKLAEVSDRLRKLLTKNLKEGGEKCE